MTSEQAPYSKSLKISVVVPAWNEATRIERSLASILSQTMQDFELIVVDDGSADETSTVAETVLAGRPNAKVLRKTNGGTGSALNLGFRMARGEYLTWWSADSWVEPNWLEVLNACLDQNPEVVMAYGDWMSFDEVTGTTQTNPVPEYDKNLLRKRCFVGPCWLFRGSAKKAAGEYLEEPCEDYDMHLRLSEVGPFKRVPHVLGTWRNHPMNVTNRLILNAKSDRWHGQAKRIRILHRQRLRDRKRGSDPTS